MSAGLYDITIEQGADWRLVLTWKDAAGDPMQLNGYTGRMQVRETWNSKTKIFELTTGNGGIVLDAANGGITLHLPAAVSAAYQVNPTKTAWIASTSPGLKASSRGTRRPAARSSATLKLPTRVIPTPSTAN